MQQAGMTSDGALSRLLRVKKQRPICQSESGRNGQGAELASRFSALGSETLSTGGAWLDNYENNMEYDRWVALSRRTVTAAISAKTSNLALAGELSRKLRCGRSGALHAET